MGLSDRITSTNIYSFDQITVVSQAAINSRLKLLHGTQEILQQFDVRHPDDENMGLIGCQLDAPQVHLVVGPNRQRITYFIHIKSGTYRFYRGVGKNATEVEYAIRDWKIALPINIALQMLNPPHIPQHVANQLKNIGDYHIYQSVLDFKAANMEEFFPGDSIITGLDQNKDLLWFKMFMNTYIDMLKAQPADGSPAPHSALHILPEITKLGNSHNIPFTSAIAPTSINIQSLSAVTREGKPAPEADEANMLAYIQMTGGNKMPSEFLQLSANWVVPHVDRAPMAEGIICLSKRSFLEDWLLPKLRKINMDSTWVTAQAEVESTFNPLSTPHWSLNGHVGIVNDDFKIQPDLADDEWVQNTKSPTGGNQFRYERSSSKKGSHGLWTVHMEGQTNNELIIPEGLNSQFESVIEIKSTTMVKCNVSRSIGEASCTVTSNWANNLILAPASDGDHLQIRFDPPTILPPEVKATYDHSGLDPVSLEPLGENIRSQFKALDLSNIVNDLNGLFAQDWPFFFPEAGQNAYVTRAFFNREGDLLCDLKYRNVPSGHSDS